MNLRPLSWLMENQDLLTPGMRALDVACGSGRHALLLAAAGLTVRAIDRHRDKIEGLRRQARQLELNFTAETLDLEMMGDVDLGTHASDLVLVVRYLHRPLFPALVRSLAPGGVLLYETFTTLQAASGKPTNPAFLLKPGELETLVSPLQVIRRREGAFDGGMVSGVAARNAL